MQEKEKPLTPLRVIFFLSLGVALLFVMGGGAAIVGDLLGMERKAALRIAEITITLCFFGWALWMWSKRPPKR